MFKLVVLSCFLALAAAQPGVLAPGLWGAGLAGPGLWGAGLAGPGLGYAGLGHGYAGLGYAGLGYAGLGHGYAGLGHGGLGAASLTVAGGSLAPGQPANVLGADGRPLDTLDVNVARAQHLTARIVDGSRHHLHKRSLLAPLAVSHVSRVDLPGGYLGYPARLAYAAPLAHGYAGPLAHGFGGPLAYGGYHGLAGPFAHAW